MGGIVRDAPDALLATATRACAFPSARIHRPAPCDRSPVRHVAEAKAGRGVIDPHRSSRSIGRKTNGYAVLNPSQGAPFPDPKRPPGKDALRLEGAWRALLGL